MAKLDRFKFAQLVAFIAKRCEDDLEQQDIGHLDWLTEQDNPPVQAVQAVEPDLSHVRNQTNAMFAALAEGMKIEAIKRHRSLTGDVLKDSKDAIEALQQRMSDMAINDFKHRLVNKIVTENIFINQNDRNAVANTIQNFT